MIEETPDIPTTDPLSEHLFANASDLPPMDFGGSFIKLFLTLISFIALFSFTIWFLRRLFLRRLENGSAEQQIHVLEKKMISPKTMLYIIEMAGQKILLAESQVEVRPIAIVKADESIELL